MLYKDENGKTYIAYFKSEMTKDKALTIANYHFKVRKDELKVINGKLNVDGMLEIGGRGDMWVVFRKVGA